MKIPRLIFIPGWGTDYTIFKPVLEKIKMPSSYIDWWNCLSNDVDDNQLYRALEKSRDPVVIVGWSLGGVLAMSAALKYKNKISGLFLISTTARLVEDEGYFGVNRNIIRTMIHRLCSNYTDVVKDFLMMCIDNNDDSISALLASAAKIEQKHLLAGLVYLQNTDIRNDLYKIMLPVNIIHGEKDRVISLNNGVYLAEKLPMTDIKIMQKEEHLFFHKNPLFLVDEISNFVSQI